MKKKQPITISGKTRYLFSKKTLLPVIVFLFTAMPSHAFDTWWHAECTRKAMTGNGFSSDARLATQVSNYLTDLFPAYAVGNEKLAEAGIKQLQLPTDISFDYMHFDAVFTEADLEYNWKLLFDNTVRTLWKYSTSPDVKPGYRLIVLFNIIGSSLHMVQDFYSHSNWVNEFAKLNRLPAPTWYEVEMAERKKMNLYTGAYPDGSSAGHKNHGDLNKDWSGILLNKEAVNAAERASIEWVKRLMDSVKTVPWSELKAYNIQKDMVMKRFLVTLDATFLTSSSIVASHFDGPSPAKFVFTPEKDLQREKNQAWMALLGVLKEYVLNMRPKENIFLLPTPYWAGYKGYHITRDLAAGLLLNNRKYTAPH